MCFEKGEGVINDEDYYQLLIFLHCDVRCKKIATVGTWLPLFLSATGSTFSMCPEIRTITGYFAAGD